MTSQRILNILSSAAIAAPEEMAAAIRACQEFWVSNHQERPAFERGKRQTPPNYVERKLAVEGVVASVIERHSGGLGNRSDLGDAFQRCQDQLLIRSGRLSQSIINNCVQAVQTAIQSGNINQLLTTIGLPIPAVPASDQPPSREEIRILSSAMPSLLGRTSKVRFAEVSGRPALEITLTGSIHPYNDPAALVRDVSGWVNDCMPQLPSDHLLRRFPVTVRHNAHA